jgi:hypothetical protein
VDAFQAEAAQAGIAGCHRALALEYVNIDCTLTVFGG